VERATAPSGFRLAVSRKRRRKRTATPNSMRPYGHRPRAKRTTARLRVTPASTRTSVAGVKP
jgi:hypothetical protein